MAEATEWRDRLATAYPTLAISTFEHEGRGWLQLQADVAAFELTKPSAVLVYNFDLVVGQLVEAVHGGGYGQCWVRDGLRQQQRGARHVDRIVGEGGHLGKSFGRHKVSHSISPARMPIIIPGPH